MTTPILAAILLRLSNSLGGRGGGQGQLHFQRICFNCLGDARLSAKGLPGHAVAVERDSYVLVSPDAIPDRFRVFIAMQQGLPRVDSALGRIKR